MAVTIIYHCYWPHLGTGHYCSEEKLMVLPQKSLIQPFLAKNFLYLTVKGIKRSAPYVLYNKLEGLKPGSQLCSEILFVEEFQTSLKYMYVMTLQWSVKYDTILEIYIYLNPFQMTFRIF